MIIYYTDGSASPNPGPGGFAVIKNGQPHLIGGEPSGNETTNIRMEGLAIHAALSDAVGAECQIFTDSEFWINVITKWAPGWEANGWKKKGGDIKNLDIVQTVYPLYKQSQAKLTWVRGHEGDEGNEMADEWANNARQRKVREVESVSEAVDEPSPAERAKAMFDVGQTMQLATIRDNRPRVNSVFYVTSNDIKAVYWMSEPSRRHSIDSTRNPHVAGAIATKTDQPVRGLQFTGTCSVVEDEQEIASVSELYSKKYNGLASDFAKRVQQGVNKHTLYKMTLDSLELFDEQYYSDAPIVTLL